MSEDFALGDFLQRWSRDARYNLAASESATLTVASLLDMAEPEDQRRWQMLGLGYADPRGAPWLRTTIAARYDGLDADDVVCCAGAQEGLACVMRALLTRDDHAVIVVPIYQPSEQAVTTICAATGVALQEKRGVWHLDVDRVATALRPETRLVLINFPNSPTGATIDPATLGALVTLCRQRGLWLVNDEVYRLTRMDQDRHGPQMADIYERGVSINAVSKGFGLPGLRVGWVVCRDGCLLAKVLTAKSALSACLAAPSEALAHIALRAAPRIVERNRAIGTANLQRLQRLLNRHPDLFEAPEPNNTAFAFPRYLGVDGADYFAMALARDASVLVLPSGLWRSPLAVVPADRLRISLGDCRVGAALEVLEDYLSVTGVR